MDSLKERELVILILEMFRIAGCTSFSKVGYK